MNTPEWIRVSRVTPCPICSKFKWCSISEDGAVAICMRLESPKPCRNGGWLHRLTDKNDRSLTRRFVIKPEESVADLSALAVQYQKALTADRLAKFAESLVLSVESLTALQVGWATDHVAWSFPMTAPSTGQIVGIRLRAPDGSKFAVKGGKEGLFIPTIESVPGAPLIVTEGATDAAAILDLGFENVVGRPSCTGGIKHLIELIRSHNTNAVVIVADADERGRCGAANLASALRVYVPAVQVIEPPAGVKDLRAWKQAGATRADVNQIIQAAPIQRLSIRTTLRGSK